MLHTFNHFIQKQIITFVRFQILGFQLNNLKKNRKNNNSNPNPKPEN